MIRNRSRSCGLRHPVPDHATQSPLAHQSGAHWPGRPPASQVHGVPGFPCPAGPLVLRICPADLADEHLDIQATSLSGRGLAARPLGIRRR